jgi:DNA-damage-inducible protein J
MPKVKTNINLDLDVKMSCQELFDDLGIDLSTAVNIFLRQCLRPQGLPFAVTRQNVLHADNAATASENYMSDSELLAISDKLTKKNQQAYEVLAK